MDSSQAIRQEKAEAKLTREVNKSTVIVVEDSQIDFQIINEILSPTYHIVGFSDAEEALAQLDELAPALFLIDYNLPQMDGVSLCEALRGNHSFAFTPIIIITGETYTSYEYKFWDAGCDDFISKPFSAITLQRRVAKALKYQALINEYKDASIGGITYPSTPENWKVLFEKADIQLYEVKNAGRNNAIVHLVEDII